MPSGKTKTKLSVKPVRSRDVPATAAMLSEMESHLQHEMRAGFERTDAKIEAVKYDVETLKSDVRTLKTDVAVLKTDAQTLKADMQIVKADISEIKIELHEIKADVHDIKSEMHRVALLVEEQNARNKFVMDGYAQIYDLLAHRRSE